MRKIPDIVKILKEEEKKGKLYVQSQSPQLELQVTEEIMENTPHKDETQKMIRDFELSALEEKFRIIFENYAIAITLADEKENIVSWNKYTEELLNMDEEDLFMKPVETLYPPEEWKKIRSEDVRQKGMKYRLETKIIRKDKGLLDVEISLCVLKGAEGKTTGSVGIIRDITKLKNTERKLIESEEKYRTIFENSAVAITLTDENENVVSWNKYAEELLGMKNEELFMKPVKSLYPPEEWKKIRSENIRQKGMQHHLETKIIHSTNKLIDVDISLSVLKNHAGDIIGSIGVIKDITERKKIERKLAFERELLQSLLDNIPDSIYFKDENCKFIKVNKAKAQHSHLTQEEMIGMTDFDFFPEQVAKKIFEDDKKVMKNGEPIINKVEKISDINGNEHWVSVTKIPRYDKEGNIIGTMGISRDITEQKKTNDKIKKSELKYRNLFETAIDPILVLDKDGVFVDVNQQVTNMFGYSKKELIGKRFDNLGILTEESLNKTLDNFNKRMKGRNVQPYEVEIVTKHGEIIPAEINANPLYEDLRIAGDLVVIRDLRERDKRIKVEKDLVESEKKFREIFDATGDFLLFLDTNGSLLDMNNTAVVVSGLEKNKVVGKPFSNLKCLFSKEGMKRHIENIDKAVQGEGVNEYECDLLSKNNTKYRFLFSNDIIEEKGEIKGVLVRGRDVTKRQRAWDELVKLEEKYRVLAETSADGVLTIDPLGRLTYVNPSFEKMCGRRKSQILATLFRDYLSEESIYLFQQISLDIRKKEEKIENIELELTHSNGNVIPIEVNIAPLKKDNEFGGMECTVRDITERKKFEDELKKSERLKTEFMNIAAHELKSPVTPIKGYLDLIIQDKDTSEKVKNWAKISLRNSMRLLRLVNDILDVSRLDSDTMRFEMEKLDLTELLNEVYEDMKPATDEKKIDFIIKIQKKLPSILGDRNRLLQVLKNLLGNAIKFTDNGSITIKAEKEDKHILISVEDTGIGISPDELKKIFTKFYQAYTGDDRKNEGTGLGLFICKEIVGKHNGEIWAESKLGKGSNFLIKLPHLQN